MIGTLLVLAATGFVLFVALSIIVNRLLYVSAPNEALVNALAMMSPYGAAEKQALLEAPDLKTRAEILVAATEIELAQAWPSGDLFDVL